METFGSHLILAATEAFTMFWDVLWPLIFGFLLSAIIQSVVSRDRISQLLGKDSLRQHTSAILFGIASSSCSYAAVALAKSLVKKDATFTNAMLFQLASTNLVVELGIILVVLLGWQFMAAQYVGGVLMVIILALLFRYTLSKKVIESAKNALAQGRAGKMEGHAAMDMSVRSGSLGSRILSQNGFTAISHYFVMDWVSIWGDLVIGFVIAGAIAAWVPIGFWNTFFFTNHHTIALDEGPLVGPFIAMLSFVCSVGNIPLAAVMWHNGMSFGGVISFIFADLLVVPILDIYRKYYGWKMMVYLFATFYTTMVLGGLIVELLFSILHLIPTNRILVNFATGIHWNYTTVLNLVFLTVGVILLYRFFTTGGPAMLRIMEAPAADQPSSRYSCPMHPDIQCDHKDTCPKCGMDFVPRKNSGHHH